MCVFGDGGGGWDMDSREKCLELYLSILGTCQRDMGHFPSITVDVYWSPAG